MSLELSTKTTRKLTKLERDWFKWYTGLAKFNATKALEYARPDNTYTTESKGQLGYQLKKSVFNKLKITLDDLYEMVGLDDTTLLNIGIDGLKATRPVVTPDGLKAVPDFAVRHKYWSDFMKSKKLMMETSRVELTGEDGGPIKFNVLAGIGFIPPKE